MRAWPMTSRNGLSARCRKLRPGLMRILAGLWSRSLSVRTGQTARAGGSAGRAGFASWRRKPITEDWWIMAKVKSEKKQAKPEFNPVAVEIVERGLRGTEPLIPPWYDGLELPLADLCAVLDWLLPRYAEAMGP